MKPKPPVPYVYRRFVDREKQIVDLHTAAKTQDPRIVLVRGRVGCGKTVLLEEFHAEAPEVNFASVYVDMSLREIEPGYLAIILEFRNQLGSQHFGELNQEFRNIRQELTGPVKEALPAEEIRAARPAQQSTPAGATPEKAADRAGGGGLTIQGNLTAPNANIAGGDIYQVYNSLPNLESLDNLWVSQQLTSAFQQDLIYLAARQEMVILLDHWEDSNDDTRDWVRDHLLKWTLSHLLSRAVLVIASIAKPLWYPERRDVATLTLGNLPAEAVIYYWEQICHLPREGLDPNLDKYAYPASLVYEAASAGAEKDGAESPNG